MKGNKECIVITQGSSSSLLYVEECRNRGIEPIIVNPPVVNPDRALFNRFAGKIRIIDMKSYDQYDETLEQVRKLDPLCVVCGSGGGVDVADMLARDLGLKGNDPETTSKRDTKNGMHQALKDAGLRYIRTAVVKSDKDIERFWKTNKIKKAMLKFSSGGGAVGNKACNSLEESIRYGREMLKSVNIFGESDDVLIQEFIEGDEYVVDTVSCDGLHMVCAFWKYNKMVSPDGDIITDETHLVTEPQLGFTELIGYAYKVLDATGIRYGACHGEFKVDDDGPVLMETNARPHGCMLTVDYLDEFLENHITDVALDAYLCPDRFRSRMERPYRPKKYATFKHLFSPKECDINMTTMARILGMMRSYRYSTTDFNEGIVHVKKTVDLETSPGILKLCNSDLEQFDKDCDFLYLLETKYFDLLEKSGDVMEGVDVCVDSILCGIKPYWRALIVDAKGETLYSYDKRKKIPKGMKTFDIVVYADASETTVAERLSSIMSCTDRLCENGVFVVMPEVYRNLPYGSAAVEIVLDLAGFTIEVPNQKYRSLIGSRYRSDHMKAEKRPVIIVQGASSAFLYVQECRLRGLEPIVLNPPEANQDRESFNRYAGGKVKVLTMSSYDEYDDMLERIRKMNPVAIVCGNNGGGVITDRMARDLGLKGNDPETTYNRNAKDGMHGALKKAGIRYIRTAEVETEEDIRKFWKQYKIKKAIMKYAVSGGAIGNKVCPTLQDALDHLAKMKKGVNNHGVHEKILMQEFIEGDEYVVDTVSCEGKHVVCAIWIYKKTVSKDKDIVTDETNLIVHPQPGTDELVRYAYKVLDATGFEYGPCHGEYKIDEDGPVLIETNARPHGTTLNAEYLDEFLANHITDVAMEAYLSPTSFAARTFGVYRPLKYATFKHLFSPKECDIDMDLLGKFLGVMESFRYSTTEFKGMAHVVKTIDLETGPATLKLCNSDYVRLRRDCDFLYQLETKYFDILEKGKDRIEAVKERSDLDQIKRIMEPYWNVLVVNNKGDYVLHYDKMTKAKEGSSGYDALVYMRSTATTVEERLGSILDSIDRIVESGYVIILSESYENLPYKSVAAELMVNLAGCSLCVPRTDCDGVGGIKY